MVIHEGTSALPEATALPEMTVMAGPDENAPYMSALRAYERYGFSADHFMNDGSAVLPKRLT
jgi:hypothetical protein